MAELEDHECVVQPMEGEGLPFEHLTNHGVLWAINRVLFHPRGFALAVHTTKETGLISGWSIIWDGSEPGTFTEETDDEHFALFEQALADARRHYVAPKPAEEPT